MCPGALIYGGSVGVGGVCGWPNAVTCADAGGVAAASSGESVGSTSVTVNVNTDEANTLAQLLNNNPSPSPPSANSVVIVAPTPPTIGSPTSNSLAIGLASTDPGYCG